jgi:hypothetical protein
MFTVTMCSSTSDVDGGAQLLVAFTPGNASPVQVSVTVPGLAGTVTSLVGGVELKVVGPTNKTNMPANVPSTATSPSLSRSFAEIKLVFDSFWDMIDLLY